MMTDNPLMSRFVEQTSMVAPEWAQSLEANLTHLSQLEHAREMMADGGAVDDGFWSTDSWKANYRPYNVQGGVLTIPVSGALLNNFSFAATFATGYQYLAAAWDRGMADPDVKGIVLSINSGGGECSGNFDLVDKMVATKEKPCIAICENAFSAAYNLAAVADEINMSRTGGVGSIGVVTGHMDASEQMKNRGIKMTFISSPEGGDKTDGTPYEALSATARERMQAKTDEFYQHFVDSVSQNRGLEEKAIRATKARTFTAAQALSNGLADSVTSGENSMAAFLADLSSNDGEHTMSVKENGAVDAATLTAANADAVTAARAEGHAAGVAEGAVAERTRIDAVTASDASKARPIATAVMLKLGQTAEATIALLEALPDETKAVADTAAAVAAAAIDGGTTAAAPDFKAAMDIAGGAKVAANTEAGALAEGGSKDDANEVLALAASAGLPGMRSSLKKAA
jgi:ClpP class serine protease